MDAGLGVGATPPARGVAMPEFPPAEHYASDDSDVEDSEVRAGDEVCVVLCALQRCDPHGPVLLYAAHSLPRVLRHAVPPPRLLRLRALTVPHTPLTPRSRARRRGSSGS